MVSARGSEVEAEAEAEADAGANAEEEAGVGVGAEAEAKAEAKAAAEEEAGAGAGAEAEAEAKAKAGEEAEVGAGAEKAGMAVDCSEARSSQNCASSARAEVEDHWAFLLTVKRDTQKERTTKSRKSWGAKAVRVIIGLSC